MSGYRTLPFSEEHIKDAAVIEAKTFSEPWSAEAMRLLCTPEYPSIALVGDGGECVGYIGSLRVLDELQIINVAVKDELRGRGLGRALLQSFEELCESLDVSFVSLEVRESNTAAISLYERFGFTVAGKRKAFYRSPVEDALVMVKNRRKDD